METLCVNLCILVLDWQQVHPICMIRRFKCHLVLQLIGDMLSISEDWSVLTNRVRYKCSIFKSSILLFFSCAETNDYPKCRGSRGWESNYYEYDQFPTLRWWSWPVPTEDTETTRRIKDMDHPWSQPHLVWLWCSDLTTFGPHNGPSMPFPGSPTA